MSNNTASRSLFTAGKGFYLNVCIMLALMVLVRFIPPVGSMTESGMAVLGVFLGTIYGWMTLKDMPLASAAGLVLMGTTGFYATDRKSTRLNSSHRT